MPRLLFFKLLFLLPLTALAQEEKDTVPKHKTLDEVFVSAKSVKKKTEVFKVTGWPSYKNMDQHDGHINLVSNYPKGKLSFVEFFFNTGFVNSFKKQLDIHYRDVEVELFLYKVKQNSQLGESLLPDTFRFVVGQQHRGAYRIDLSKFNIQEEKIFIGIKVIGKTVPGETNFYVRMNESKEAVGFEAHHSLPGWHKLFHSETFKLKLGIEK